MKKHLILILLLIFLAPLNSFPQADSGLVATDSSNLQIHEYQKSLEEAMIY